MASGRTPKAVSCVLWVAISAQAAEAQAQLPFRIANDGLSLRGLKGTEKGAPTEPTNTVGYLDHFALDVRLGPTGAGDGKPQGWTLAAWFGKATAEQLKAKFEKEDDRGSPYEIRDSRGALVPPHSAGDGKAIPFHPEYSNKNAQRASLSKGIGGAAIPLVPAQAGVMRLYSSMHQRFSFSLVATQEKHAAAFGARYPIEQLKELPEGMYELRLPFTAAVVDAESRVVSIQHGACLLKLDLSIDHRDEVLDSLKGSGSPKLPFK